MHCVERLGNKVLSIFNDTDEFKTLRERVKSYEYDGVWSLKASRLFHMF